MHDSGVQAFLILLGVVGWIGYEIGRCHGKWLARRQAKREADAAACRRMEREYQRRRMDEQRA